MFYLAKKSTVPLFMSELVDPNRWSQLIYVALGWKSTGSLSSEASLPSQVIPGDRRFNRVHRAFHDGISPSLIA